MVELAAISGPVRGNLASLGLVFVNIGAAQSALMSTLGSRTRRDLRRGVDKGRFHIDDVDLAVARAFGMLIAAVERGLTRPEIADADQLYAKAMVQNGWHRPFRGGPGRSLSAT